MKRKKKNKPCTVAILADGQNVDLSKYGRPILKFCRHFGEPRIQWAYHHWRLIKETVQERLLTDGWQCLDIGSNAKNKLDQLLISNAKQLDAFGNPDILVIVSGDKDFAPLVQERLAANQQVKVIGRGGHTSHRLHQLLPNDVYAVERLGSGKF